jgi:hypothetical protein
VRVVVFHVFHLHFVSPGVENIAPTQAFAKTQKSVHGSMGLPNEFSEAPWYGGHIFHPNNENQ